MSTLLVPICSKKEAFYSNIKPTLNYYFDCNYTFSAITFIELTS